MKLLTLSSSSEDIDILEDKIGKKKGLNKNVRQTAGFKFWWEWLIVTYDARVKDWGVELLVAEKIDRISISKREYM